MDREALLVAALGAAVLTGCTHHDARKPAPRPTPSPTTDPEAVVLAAWWAQEETLYSATPPGHLPFRAAHRARRIAIEERLRARGLPLPSQPERWTLDLAGAERSYVRSLAGLTDPDLVTLGAELAAGARQHAVVLGLAR